MHPTALGSNSLVLHALFLEISIQAAAGDAPAAGQQERVYHLLFNGTRSPVAAMIRHYLAVCPGFRRYLQSTVEEADLRHDIYLQLFHALQRGGYRGERTNPHGFVKTIAVRYIRGLGRLAQTRRCHQAPAEPDGPPDPMDRLADYRQSPRADLDHQWISCSVDWVTSQLSATDRCILRARYVEDLSHEEIARRAGKPSSCAARVGLMRAQRRARKLLADRPQLVVMLQGALSRASQHAV
jgi:RNA polymerase sigma factor (sigma-70 family)